MKRLITFLVGCFSLFLLSPFVAEAGIGVTGGLNRERVVEIGKTYTGAIIVKNPAKEPQGVKVYQTDWLFFCDGKNIYGKPGEDVRSNAKWITFTPAQLTIPPEGTAMINYIITVPTVIVPTVIAPDTAVPDGKPPVGTYWSSMMIEGSSTGSLETAPAGENKVSANIVQNIRYNVRIVTHIGDTGSRALKFLNTDLIRQSEKRILRVDIENIGERALLSRLWLELYNKEGANMGKFEGKTSYTFPGTSVRFGIDLSEVPEGEYQALIVADCGKDDVFGMTYTLKLKDKE